MKVKKLKLEKGMYEEAKNQGIGFAQYLEDHYAKEAGEKSVFSGRSMLEQEMIKMRLRAAGKDVPMTAFEKQLQAHDIKAFGIGTDPVSKFFNTGESAVLFPAFLSNRLIAGLLMSSLVPELVAFTEVIDSVNYQKLTLEDSEDDRQLRQVNEGEEFPGVRIKVGKEMVMMKKYGRYLQASYESISSQKINVYGAFIQRIGAQLGIDETDDLLYVLKNGDGNANTPGKTVSTAVSGTIGVGDVISWATGLAAPYKMNKFVGKKALLQEYYETLAGMNNPSDQFGFIGIGLPKALEWDRSSMTSDNFLGVDTRYACAHLSMGEPMVESEKIIRRQLNGTALSVYSGYMIMDNQAVGVFDETH